MNNETSREVLEKTALLQKMRSVPELFVLMSACTKEPYVECDADVYKRQQRECAAATPRQIW